MEMFGRRGLGILWLLLTVLIASAVGVAAYQAGVGTAVSHVAATAPPGTVVVPAYDGGYGWGWGPAFGAFHLIGFFFFVLLLLFLVRFAFRPWGRGYYRGRGWTGPGGPQGQGGYPPQIQQAFEDLHRKAHGEQPAPPPEQKSQT
jgi:hypothetical protein